MAQTDQHEQEVRFAIVLYGGVSLAIYINGVMQELLRLVRSTSGMALPEKGSENVYFELGSILDRGFIPDKDATGDGKIRTKFKVDIISGTSAGGINGVFLAKALANESDLSPIQQLWFDEGAIERLLNDRSSYQGVGTPPSNTESLLNSQRMYRKLLDAFDSMDKGDRGTPSRDGSKSVLAEEIDLFATTTDIDGVPIPIQLFDNVVYERRHRNVFHLRYIDGERNDFQSDNNPFLAFAARCTSSFPFAFEPMQLCDMDATLQGHGTYAEKDYCASKSTRWRKFYTNYLDGIYPGATKFPQRSFGDGGYLNNAPFSYAVDALLHRQADVPVDRKLLYVEPSPAHPEEAQEPTERPNAVENSIAALVTIPGYQTIRNDLMRVLERNRAATKIDKTVSEIEAHIQNTPDACRLPDGGLSEIWFRDDVYFGGYYQMRATEVTDLLALMVARMRSIDEGSAHFSSLRSLIRVWRDAAYHVDARVASGGHGSLEDLSRFLRDFDLPYRLRRLRFVLRKLDTLYALRLPPDHPVYADALSTLAFGLEQSNPAADLPSGIREVRAQLAQQYKALHDLMRRLLQAPDPEDKDTPPGGQASTGTRPEKVVRDVIPSRDKVIAVLSKIVGMEEISTSGTPLTGASPALTTHSMDRAANEPRDAQLLYDQRAAALIRSQPDLLTGLRDLGTRLQTLLSGQIQSAHDAALESFAHPISGQIARRYYHCFDLFDAVQFPMSFGTDVGEADVVEIIRVAPEDATALSGTAEEARTKLKGLVAAHFGAFLDADWRRNDLLWGRLDAAERIITALLPWRDSNPLRDRLIDQAHNAILNDFGAQTLLGDMATRQAVDQGPQAKLTPANVSQVIDAVLPPLAPPSRTAHRTFMRIWRDVVPSEMNPVLLMKTLARGSEIIGRMLETISARQELPAQASWITNAGRAFWGVVEISVPRSPGKLLGTYWQSLLFLIAGILIAAGLISGQAGVSSVGWACFAIAVALFTLRRALGSFMRGRSAWRFIRALAIVVLTAIFAIGGWRVYDWGRTSWNGAQEKVCQWFHTCSATGQGH
jgi:patatin-related protein